MRTVELVPDPATEALVLEAWRRLLAAGLPSLATNEHPTNRPHLTLAEADEVPEDDVRALLEDALPLDLALGATGVFRTRRGSAVHVVVVPDPGLVALHAAVVDVLSRSGTGPRPHLAPGSWAPHLSVALRVPDEQVGACVEVLGGSLQGVRGRWESARSYTSDERTVTPLTGRT